MGIPNVGALSLGQYTAEVSGWNRAHGPNKPVAPTEDEFELAMARVRGLH